MNRPSVLAIPLCLTLLASGVNAQSHIGSGSATPYVHPADPVYRDIERLLTAGLLPATIFGQRPFSAREMARLASVADSTLQALRAQAAAPVADIDLHSRARRTDWADGAIRRLRSAAAGRPLAASGWIEGGGRGQLLMLHSSSPARGIPYRGIGHNAGIISSAGTNRSGVLLDEGVVAVGDIGLWGAAGPLAISGSVRTRVGADDPFAGDDTSPVRLQTISARLVVKNAALTVGRDQLHWAPMTTGGLALSTSVRPVDQVILTMERPVRIPWVSKLAGPVRAGIFLADLGESQYFPHTRLTGYKVTILPHDRFELGSSILTQWGGEGSPEASFGTILRDHFPFLSSRGGGTYEVSNKVATIDGRLRLSNRSGLTIYGEIATDDLDKQRIFRGMYDDGSQLVGLRLPAAGADGRWDLTLEARRTGLRFYNHHQFRSGLTVDGAILGDVLGPNGQAAYLSIVRGMGATGSDGGVEVMYAVERRSMDEWRIRSDPFGFEHVASHPAEWRNRLTVGWFGTRGSSTTFQARIAVERITNWAGEGEANRWGAVSELSTSVRF